MIAGTQTYSLMGVHRTHLHNFPLSFLLLPQASIDAWPP